MQDNQNISICAVGSRGDRVADADGCVLIGIGANLAPPGHPTPLAGCQAALTALAAQGIAILARSRWYLSAPVPASDQPWFVNAVAAVETGLSPESLLQTLIAVESAFGRNRRQRWAARVLDLDLLAYGRIVRDGGGGLELPHPRLHERLFVLRPLADIVPGWRHPTTGAALPDMLAALAPGQSLRVLTDFGQETLESIDSG